IEVLGGGLQPAALASHTSVRDAKEDPMRKITLVALAALFTVSQAPTLSQGGTPTSATDVTNAEVLTILKMARLDEQLKVVDMGKYNVGVGVLHRGKTGAGASTAAGVSGYSHNQVTEVYYIVSGSGTLVTGGARVNARPADLGVLAGPSMSGRFQNGHS